MTAFRFSPVGIRTSGRIRTDVADAEDESYMPTNNATSKNVKFHQVMADSAVTTETQQENDGRSHKRKKREREPIPFHERIGCSVADAVEASGQSRSRLYEKMNSGKLAFWKDGKHRIVSVQSLLALKD